VGHFFENLLPEGNSLDDAVAAHHLSKANLYGLLLILGRESTKAISLLAENTLPEQIPDSRQKVTRDELVKGSAAVRMSRSMSGMDGCGYRSQNIRTSSRSISTTSS
jgi:hypothetical protein